MKNIFYIFIVLLCIGCDDPEPIRGGKETRISGKVYEGSDKYGFKGQKIVVAEYMATQRYGQITPNYYFKGNIDSVYTDNNGNFDFTFKTTGRGNTYRIYCESTDDVFIYSDYHEIDSRTLEKPVELSIYGIQLYPMVLRIRPNNLAVLPVRVTVSSPAQPYSVEDITQNNVEAIRYIYVDKNSKTNIRFVRMSADYDYKYYNAEIPATGIGEPTEHSIELNETDFFD